MARVGGNVVVVWKPQGLQKHMKATGIAFLHIALAKLTAEAKMRCPVDTGRLRSSITYEVDSQRMTGRYGTNVEYAMAQEEGTSRGVTGKHYLRGALEAKKAELERLWKM